LLVAFLPGLLVVLGLTVGMLALLVAAGGYMDSKIAVRIPNPFTPANLVVIGAMSIIFAILVGIIR
jgi:hypothetical protein